MGHYLELARQVIHHPPIAVRPKDQERQAIRAAIRRLQLGETEAIRFYSRTCGGQMLVLRTNDIPDSIAVDIPTFTLNELKELIGADLEHVRAVYELKRAFPATTVKVKHETIITGGVIRNKQTPHLEDIS